jgi:hypothetical protein
MIPGLSFDHRSYRTVPRSRVIDHLLAHGWLFEQPAKVRSEAETALDRLIGLGLPHQADHFDPVEVMNAIRAAGRAGLDPTWAGRLLYNGRRLVSPDHLPGPAPDLSSLPDQDYQVTIRRAFNLPASEPVRLRLPLPLDMNGSPTLTCSVPAAEMRTGDGWADFRLTVPETGDVICSADLTLTAGVQGPDGSDLNPQDRALYTRPVEGLVRVTPRVRALAMTLAESETLSVRKLHRLLDFMDQDLRPGNVSHYRINPSDPADLVLDEGWYDCLLGSALLAGLCRAVDIPARLLCGYGMYPAGTGNHFWIEVWLESAGWTPVDVLRMELGQAGGGLAWRNLFVGKQDHWMVVERLPRQFAGMGSVRLPGAWHQISRRVPGGLASDMLDAESGRLIYSEEVVVRLAEPDS